MQKEYHKSTQKSNALGMISLKFENKSKSTKSINGKDFHIKKNLILSKNFKTRQINVNDKSENKGKNSFYDDQQQIQLTSQQRLQKFKKQRSKQLMSLFYEYDSQQKNSNKNSPVKQIRNAKSSQGLRSNNIQIAQSKQQLFPLKNQNPPQLIILEKSNSLAINTLNQFQLQRKQSQQYIDTKKNHLQIQSSDQSQNHSQVNFQSKTHTNLNSIRNNENFGSLNPNRISIALSSSKHYLKIPKSSKQPSKLVSDNNSKNDSRPMSCCSDDCFSQSPKFTPDFENVNKVLKSEGMNRKMKHSKKRNSSSKGNTTESKQQSNYIINQSQMFRK